MYCVFTIVGPLLIDIPPQDNKKDRRKERNRNKRVREERNEVLNAREVRDGVLPSFAVLCIGTCSLLYLERHVLLSCFMTSLRP